jgi:fatty acid-binding protein DegV
VLAVILSSALSGTFGSAEAAAKRIDDAPSCWWIRSARR